MVVHFGVPEPDAPLARAMLGAIITLAGVMLLGFAILHQLRRHRVDPDAAIHGLVLLLVLVVAVFAGGYVLLERASPGQVAGLDTRLDSLYFTLSVLTSVGFGDVHASGQIARGVVAVQLVFDVVLVAAVAGTLAKRFRERPGPADVRSGDG